MKKDVVMKKNSFVHGAFITTFGIILAKLLGAFYVIPFHAMIGDVGGALFGYAYTIYNFFISLASAGIPLAISKLVSEYQALGYNNVKTRVFRLGKKLSLLMGVICFIISFFLAPLLAYLILGGVDGANSIDDVTFVIRVVSTALLVIPILGIYRGYFEGHRFMSPPSISQVLEQIVRVLVILLGTFFALHVFNYDLTTAVGVALFAATVGAISSYFYLLIKMQKNKSKFRARIRSVNEPFISNKMIYKKIFYYALPFIMIDFLKSFYSFVDMLTVVKGLVRVSYQAVDAEIVYSTMSTWASKFNMILLAISSGICVSIIPNFTDSMVKKKDKDIEKKIIQAISILLFFTVPITFGISFLAKPIWTLFYGKSLYGPSVLSYYIFVGLFLSLLTVLITILQTLKDYKVLFYSLVLGIFIKIIFNTSFILVFDKINLPAYYGVISASIVGYLVSIIIDLIYLKKKYSIHFEAFIHSFIDIFCGSLLMIFVLFLLRYLIQFNTSSLILLLLIILLYGIVGVIVYFVYTYKSHTIQDIFGNDFKKYFKKNKK